MHRDERIEQREAHHFVVRDRGRARLSPADAEVRGLVLVRLMVDARFQGRGYGRDALDAVVELTRQRGLGLLRLSVVPENTQALEFYRRNGFAETGELEGRELMMVRRL